MGASMVKWTQKVLRYNKIKPFFSFLKGLKVVPKCCLDCISFHDDICCCVQYLKVENQVEILNTYH